MKSNLYQTLLVSIGLCLVASLGVSSSVFFLRERQEESKLLDQQKNVLISANLYQEGLDVKEFFKQVKVLYINLDEKKIVQEKTKEKVVIKDDIAKIYQRPKVIEIYFVPQSQVFIFPIYGKGLWSTMYGFLTLKKDLNTVEGIAFYQHGETPGLGGEIDNKKWKSSWKEKIIFNEGQEVFLQVVKHQAEKSYEIDSLSGATITAKGVENTIKYWFKEYSKIFPLLKELL